MKSAVAEGTLFIKSPVAQGEFGAALGWQNAKNGTFVHQIEV